MYELPASHSECTRPLFTGPHLSLVIDAVLAGNSPGRIWVDDPQEPRAAFLWDAGSCYYLVGDPANSSLHASVAAVVAGSAAHGPAYFKIAYSPDGWEAVIPALFEGVSLVKRERLLLSLRAARPLGEGDGPPEGFSVRRIDAALLADVSLKNRELVSGEIASCWPSLDRFLVHGFGTVALREKEIVCWCTAEYVSEGKCGIGIETVEESQGRGLATLAASALVEQALAQRRIPHWDSWQDNLPSLAVARKVGFEELLAYPVYFGRTRPAASHP